VIQSLWLQAAAQQGRKEQGASAASGSHEAGPSLPAEITQRQCLDASYFASSSVAGAADTSLADLEGLVPDDELRAARATATLQHLLQLPQLSFMAACGKSDDAPAHMYC
jgi:hypothetical protein